MTWCLYYLTKHPEIQEKVYKELEDVLGDEDIKPQVAEVKLLNVSIQQLIRPLLQSSLFESHVEDARDARSVTEGSARGNKKVILPITPRALLDRRLKDDRGRVRFIIIHSTGDSIGDNIKLELLIYLHYWSST